MKLLSIRTTRLNIALMTLAMCMTALLAAPVLAQEPPPSTAPTTVCTSDTDPTEGAGECAAAGQVCDSGTCVYKLTNPLGTNSIPQLVGRVITIFTGVSGSLALLMFIYGGFLWIFSGGEAERVQKGKDVMKWAVIGLFIMFGAYALVNLVFKGFGL